MTKRVLFGIVMLLALGNLALPVFAQEAQCATGSVFVSVEDKDGHPVEGLTAADFHVLRGNAIVTVTRAEPSPPRRIVILLDQSGSMFDDFLYHTSANLIANIVKQSGSGIEFAFATYANDFRVRKDLSSNHEELIQIVQQTLSDKSTVWGPSAMLDASERGLEVFTPPRIGDAILFVTDGGENMSRATQADVERRFAGSDARLFAAVIARKNMTGYSEDAERKEISAVKKLIDAVGGETFWLGANYSMSRPHQKDIKFRVEVNGRNMSDLAEGILRNMATSYRLEVSLPGGIRNPQEWKLEIAAGANAKKSELFVRHPSKLFPCATAATQK